jgi:hypothetical protein
MLSFYILSGDGVTSRQRKRSIPTKPSCVFADSAPFPRICLGNGALGVFSEQVINRFNKQRLGSHIPVKSKLPQLFVCSGIEGSRHFLFPGACRGIKARGPGDALLRRCWRVCGRCLWFVTRRRVGGRYFAHSFCKARSFCHRMPFLLHCLLAILPHCWHKGNQDRVCNVRRSQRYNFAISSAALPCGSYSWAVCPTVSAWTYAARCRRAIGATSRP